MISITITMFFGIIATASGFTLSKFTQELEPEWAYTNINNFIPSNGDYFQANLEKGIGYLINNKNKNFTIFPILSGQRQYVCYIGRCYYGATPEQKWVVEEINIQYDRITFSESGRFLRLYADGETRTSYGIHGHAYFDSMIQKDTKFQSMGCILVADEVLDVIEKSFYANENKLNVLTYS